jgi:hypothetical protein
MKANDRPLSIDDAIAAYARHDLYVGAVSAELAAVILRLERERDAAREEADHERALRYGIRMDNDRDAVPHSEDDRAPVATGNRARNTERSYPMSESLEALRSEMEDIQRQLGRLQATEFRLVEMLFALTDSERERADVAIAAYMERAERAEADAAALLGLIRDAVQVWDDTTVEPTALDDEMGRMATALEKSTAGAALLAELDAARCVARVGAGIPTPPWSALLSAVQAVVRTWRALSRCEEQP